MVRIYTRTGDRGETSLLSGGRVTKDDTRVEAYGCLDELSSVLGLLRCEPLPDGVDQQLAAVQTTLLALGAVMADRAGKHQHKPSAWDCAQLERWIDTMEAHLQPLTAFLLPGGCRAAALTHLARTVCRRAERRAITVERDQGPLADGVLQYLNRLSDTLFVLARYLNASLDLPDLHP